MTLSTNSLLLMAIVTVAGTIAFSVLVDKVNKLQQLVFENSRAILRLMNQEEK